MYFSDKIHEMNNEFVSLCQQHSVGELYVFGSSVTDQFDEERSDIDLLVEIEENDPLERGAKLMSLWDKLEEFFQRKVDLLTKATIKNPVLRKSIDATKVLVYDGRGQKVLI